MVSDVETEREVTAEACPDKDLDSVSVLRSQVEMLCPAIMMVESLRS